MSWEAIQAISELVAAGGVILSLIYLAAQVRQNTRSIRTAANQDLMTAFNNAAAVAGQSPHGARVYRALLWSDWEALDADEAAAARSLLMQVTRVFEQAYVQRRAGFLDDDVWDGWLRHMKLTMGLPGIAAGWPAMRQIVNADFASLIDDLVKEGPEAVDQYRRGWGEAGGAIPENEG
jgi:hypothetical protein